MDKMRKIYDLKDDAKWIKMVQSASLDKKSDSGLKIQNGLLFGTEDWFRAIEDERIKKTVIIGVISKVFMSGHNDFPEFEIVNELGKTTWVRKGFDDAYKGGRKIELTYVEQLYKRPIDVLGPISKCVLQIKVEQYKRVRWLTSRST